MKKAKKILLTVGAYILTAALAIGGTVAYLHSEDSDVNVMTLGNVKIEQIEQEYDENGNLVDFTQDKPLYPYVGKLGWKNLGDNGAYRQFTMNNVIDKYVSVKNTGKSDAYVRTLIALEMGSLSIEELASVIGLSTNNENGSEFKFPGAWNIVKDYVDVIDGKNYNVMEFVHSAPLKPGETTVPSLLQVYLSKNATNEHVEKLDGNGNGKYDILVLSQAVQVAGFENANAALQSKAPSFAAAKAALDTAFGVPEQKKVNAEITNCAEWFTGAIADYEASLVDTWDGTADTSWYNDTDKEFTLATAEELAGFANLANNGTSFSGKTILLDYNIDLDGKQWTPINKFNGKLDGNGHRISNFHIDATANHGGFFNVLEWATVEGLTLTDVTATVGDYRFGALARSINQTNIDNVTVKNVNVTTTTPKAFVAGLFSHGTVNSNMEVNNCTVEDLTVNAENGADMIGGITTFVQKNGTEAEGTNIFENLNVKNFKVIVNDDDGVCGVGGLVGQTQSVWQNPRFNNCTVAGLVVTATGSVDVGGFICYPGSVTFAENCTTEGKIDVTGVTSVNDYAGGFFANYGWGDNIGKGDHKVTSCSADVDITTKYASAGGFVGSGTNSEGKNKNITLTNCEAKGTMTCVEGGTAIIGAFAGQTDRGIYTNCSAAQNPFIGKVLDGYTIIDDGNGTLTVTK